MLITTEDDFVLATSTFSQVPVPVPSTTRLAYTNIIRSAYVDKSRQRQTIDSDASEQDEFVRHRTSQSQHGRQQFNVRSWRHPGEQAAGLQSPQCFHVAETSLSRM